MHTRTHSHSRHVWLILLLLLFLLLTVTGLGIGRGAQVAPGRVAPDTSRAALVALGDSIFHGRVAGALCTTCHGADARGLARMGPDLTDRTWLHGDGSPEFIARIITTGVMQPKQSEVMMPPFGGTPLTPAQVRAVATYLQSIRR